MPRLEEKALGILKRSRTGMGSPTVDMKAVMESVRPTITEAKKNPSINLFKKQLFQH